MAGRTAAACLLVFVGFACMAFTAEAVNGGKICKVRRGCAAAKLRPGQDAVSLNGLTGRKQTP